MTVHWALKVSVGWKSISFSNTVSVNSCRCFYLELAPKKTHGQSSIHPTIDFLISTDECLAVNLIPLVDVTVNLKLTAGGELER